jgi:hypothetical protein
MHDVKQADPAEWSSPPWDAALVDLAGSWPGYVFTGDPLKLLAGHFRLGHGNGAHDSRSRVCFRR